MDWHAVNGRIAGTLLRRRCLSLQAQRIDRRRHRFAEAARRRASGRAAEYRRAATQHFDPHAVFPGPIPGL